MALRVNLHVSEGGILGRPTTSTTLNALAMSSTSYTSGTGASGSITGATAGSTIALTNGPTGLTINSAARTWTYAGSAGAASGTLTLTETLAGATNTPRATNLSYTVAAAAGQASLVFPQSATYAAGKFGNGLAISSTSYAQVPSSTFSTPPVPFSVECFFNLASASKAGNQTLIGQYDDSFGVQLQILLVAGVPRIVLNGNIFNGSTDFGDGVTHHMLYTGDWASFDTPVGVGAKLYIDGTLALSADSRRNPSAVYSTQRTTIGGIGNVADVFAGNIDNVAFWSGVKASTTVPVAEYVGNEANLLAYYKLNSSGADSKA